MSESSSRALSRHSDPAHGCSVESLEATLRDNLRFYFLTDLERASPHALYHALALTVRDRLARQWQLTETAYERLGSKQVCYLSAEFLLGRLLSHNLLCLDLLGPVSELLSRHQHALPDIAEEELEPGLGNGGLGRLAACFLESLATRSYPAIGYGIRYEFGIFEQEIRHGWQLEKGDAWLSSACPWELTREELAVEVRFFGREEHSRDEDGNFCVRWVDTQRVIAVPHDLPTAGFRNATVNTLRLWSARAPQQFNFALFNEGDYRRAVEDKVLVESISKVLYPNDETDEGKLLRLKQQYFFVSASLQDVLRRFKAMHGTEWHKLPDFATFQLNDTHPSVAVAEMMHLLIDREGLAWDTAWELCRKSINYTNHTLLPEALERWPAAMFQRLLPRHLSIILEINRRFLREMHVLRPQDHALQERVALVSAHEPTEVRMAHLAVVGSAHVNGVSAMHSELVKSKLFADFYRHTPDKFLNVTNGVNHRRWLYAINQPLASTLSARLGEGWLTDLVQLGGLRAHADDEVFLAALGRAKTEKKAELCAWLKATQGIRVNPEAIFDTHIKRIHEYKRQLLNCLHIVALYRSLKAGTAPKAPPRVFFFAGKAAPGYARAKLHIKLINDVAALIAQDRDMAGRLSVHFLPNYGVALAERLIPATDISEQISTAGYEASGTGNMKFSLNGALTLGTLDGANVELRESVGKEHFLLFGQSVEQLDALRQEGYDPGRYIQASPRLAEAIDAIEDGWFSPEEPTRYRALVNDLRSRDPYFLCADFDDYVRAQEEAAARYLDPQGWRRSMLHAIAGGGDFSSDRSVDTYAADIWNLKRVDPAAAESR